jgi:HK97 family phage prohead protease
MESFMTPSALARLQPCLKIAGYASLFGKRDLTGDMIMPGAFSKSLKEKGAKGIRMLWQHEPGEPIGLWTKALEDAQGLYVEGYLLDRVNRARELRALVEAGAIEGLSIGYKTKNAIRDRKTGLRRLYAVDLWEVSLVTFPMLPDARLEQLSSKTNTISPVMRLRAAADRLSQISAHH